MQKKIHTEKNSNFFNITDISLTSSSFSPAHPLWPGAIVIVVVLVYLHSNYFVIT